MTLSLLHCVPDPVQLTTWATRHRLLSPDGDEGYALHALLTAAFGERAPKPFRYLDPHQGLLAYTNHPIEELQENAVLAPPDIDRALGLRTLSAKRFPNLWRTGQTLAFEVRVRPVIRTTDGRERDVFLREAEQHPDEILSRSDTYADWLVSRMNSQDAVRIKQIRMDAFRLCRIIRRGNQSTGARPLHTICGPDVIFKGKLIINNGEHFNRLLERGIGRHRAFGFGMLLLKPAGSC